MAADLLLDRKRAAERLLAALAALPDAQREAFLLQQEGELLVEEIAVATGVSRETARSGLRFAVVKLRASLGKVSLSCRATMSFAVSTSTPTGRALRSRARRISSRLRS